MLLEFEFKVSTVFARKGEDYETIVRLPIKYTYTKEDLEGFAINELCHKSLKDFLQVICRNDEDLVQENLKDLKNGIEISLPNNYEHWFKTYLELKYQAKLLHNLDNEDCRIGDTLYLSDMLKQE